MLNRRARWALVLGCSLTLAAGCAGRKVRDDFESRQAHDEALVKEVAVQPITEGPYHLALRLGAPAIEAMVREAVAPRLAEIDPAGMGGDLGPEAARFAEAVELSRLSLGDVEVTFPGDTDGILRARVKLEGRIGVRVARIIELAKKELPIDPSQRQQLMDLLKDFQAPGGAMGGRRGGGRLQDLINQFTASDEPRWINIAPEVTVRVFMGAEVVDDRPALVMEMREVESFSLGVEGPLQLALVSGLVQEVGRQRIAAMLTDPAVNPGVRKSIPLPEKAGSGDLPVRLLGIGLDVIPGADGEIFLGIATNLNVPPGLSAASDIAPLGDNAWALTLSEGTLGLLMRTMAKEGRIPLRYGRDKQPDPEGPIVVEPESISLGDGSFTLATRIWNLKAPAFWRHFDIYGAFAVDGGQLKPEIQRIEGTDEGKGNLWAAGIVEKRQVGASETTVTQAGQRAKPSLPLPMSGGKRVLELGVSDAVATPGALTIMGKVQIKDAPPR